MTQPEILTFTATERTVPPVPEELADTDVPASFLYDLALKHVAALTDPTIAAIAERLCLPHPLTEELLRHLYREELIEVRAPAARGTTGYAMLERGRERLTRAQSLCDYAGPAPVSLTDYTYMMRLQAVPTRLATLESVQAALGDLVLPDSLLQTLGCAINSRRSLFLTGAPGTGKTAILERLSGILSDAMWVPYAIEIDGQIIRVRDADDHEIVSAPVSESTAEPITESITRRVVAEEAPHSGHDRRWLYDRRWLRIERPVVIVGSELTLASADLQWSEAKRIYEAPFQMRANGGAFVIDDFGRQRIAPHDLLNRWMTPLERRVDYLTLRTGKKIEVPFEQLVVFATNLNVKDVADEAFLKRISYRVHLDPPSPHTYVEILRRAAAARHLQVSQACVNHLLNKYLTERRQVRACEPGDLLNGVTDICLLAGREPELTPELIDIAWHNHYGVTHGFDG